MTRFIDAVFENAVQQLDREDRRLASMAATAGSAPVLDHDGFLAMNRALSYVVMGGVLEEMMRDLPSAIAADINSLGVERRHLPVSLLAAIDSAIFRQCKEDNVTALISRTNLLAIATSHAVDTRPVLEFGDLFKLADGQTISEKHFKALWSVLSLNGDWRNNQNDSMLLREIQTKRNDVAHWTDDPVNIGRSKRISDLRQMVSRLVDLVQHFQLTIWYWLEERSKAASLP